MLTSHRQQSWARITSNLDESVMEDDVVVSTYWIAIVLEPISLIFFWHLTHWVEIVRRRLLAH